MKVVILAGGTQSIIAEEREGIPKPMVTIGEKPILWHLMKYFSSQGFCDFIVCGGYKVNMIKDYFMDFYIYQSDITVNLEDNTVKIHKKKTEDWNVTVVDTGIDTPPGQRVLFAKDYIGSDDFILIHGDCLFNIDVKKLVEVHNRDGKVATVSVAHPTGRNEILPLCSDGVVMVDSEAKLPENQAWVNACCKVLTGNIYGYLEKSSDLGKKLFHDLAEDNQIMTYKHYGFWSPVETKRDYTLLQRLWNQNEAPWKVW